MSHDQRLLYLKASKTHCNESYGDGCHPRLVDDANPQWSQALRGSSDRINAGGAEQHRLRRVPLWNGTGGDDSGLLLRFAKRAVKPTEGFRGKEPRKRNEAAKETGEGEGVA